MKIMNKVYFTILFILFYFYSNSQSINIGVGYNYYFLDQKEYSDELGIKQDINFIGEITFNKYFKKSAIEVGYAYGTKNYSFDFTKLYNDVNVSEITSSYHHIPILFSHRLFVIKKTFISINTGIVFFRINKFSSKNSYDDGSISYEDGSEFNYHVGALAHFGIKCSFNLNNSVVLNFAPYYKYKFLNDYDTPNTSHEPTTDTQIGLKLSFEWLLKNNIKFYDN